MSKRHISEFSGSAKDEWDTPLKPVLELLPYLDPEELISEPCAGGGALARHLHSNGFAVAEMYDIRPRATGIEIGDATQRTPEYLSVTNPPYTRAPLLKLLSASAEWAKPSWWLLPWDVTCNLYFAEFSSRVSAMIPVGRVSWLGNGSGGMENFGWIKLEPNPVADPALKRRQKRGDTQ